MQMRGASWRLHVPSDSRLRRVLIAYGLNGLIEFATWLAILLVAYNEGGPFLAGVASFSMLLPAMTLAATERTLVVLVPPGGRAASRGRGCPPSGPRNTQL